MDRQVLAGRRSNSGTVRFMIQIARHLTDATDGVLTERHVLICDRDRKWSTGVRHLLETSGVRVVQTPYRARPTAMHTRSGSYARSKKNA